MIYVLQDIYGNEIGTTSKDLANEIVNSGANPFNTIDKLNEYNGIIVNSLEEFCSIFY